MPIHILHPFLNWIVSIEFYEFFRHILDVNAIYGSFQNSNVKTCWGSVVYLLQKILFFSLQEPSSLIARWDPICDFLTFSTYEHQGAQKPSSFQRQDSPPWEVLAKKEVPRLRKEG